MDTPKTCADCPFALQVGYYLSACIIANDEDGNYKAISDTSYEKKVEDWCPLRPLPEKDIKSYFPDGFEDGYTAGWNACIDEIAGGESND